MKHTPGPWEVRDNRIWNPDLKVGDIAHIYCKSTSDKADFKDDEMGQANAGFIVKACNAHYDLLEVVELYLADCELERLEYNDDTYNLAKKAIAKTS
jgi:hypothetical protein